MFLRTIKMVGIGAIAVLLAEHAVADNDWRKAGEDVWKKHLDSGATARIIILGKRTHFALTVPCANDHSTETYRWIAGETIARSEDPCPNNRPAVKVRQVIQEFLPLPTDYDPLRKRVAIQRELII